MRRIVESLMLWLFLAIINSGFAAEVTGVRLLSDRGTAATLTIDFAGSLTAIVFTLDKPDRVVVDLEGVQRLPERQVKALRADLLRSVRSGMQGPNRLRLVLDVKRPLKARGTLQGSTLTVELSSPDGKRGSAGQMVLRSSGNSSPEPIANRSEAVPTPPPTNNDSPPRATAFQGNNVPAMAKGHTPIPPPPAKTSRSAPADLVKAVREALAPRPDAVPANGGPLNATDQGIMGPSSSPEPVDSTESSHLPPAPVVRGGNHSGELTPPPSPSPTHLTQTETRPAEIIRAKVDAPPLSKTGDPQSAEPHVNKMNREPHTVNAPRQKTTPEPRVTAKTPPRKIVVAVDAGHGGKDPGATGPGGRQEKDVTLAIARRLASLLERERGIHSVLIRDGDYFVPLRDRIDKARHHKADLFVSIHADAVENGEARGASVYVLSEKGATSEAARWLAERENAADLVGGVHLDTRDNELAKVLLDMSQTAAHGASVQVASRVLSSLGKLGDINRTGVERAGFLVLKSPDIPSLLVETAFISNSEEEEKLGSPAFQQEMAQAITNGIRGYFIKNPPPGTQLAETGESTSGPGTFKNNVTAQAGR